MKKKNFVKEESINLTKREIEIVKLIADELDNVSISEKLCISIHTVETHRKNIFRKTKARTIVGLVKFAYENGMVEKNNKVIT